MNKKNNFNNNDYFSDDEVEEQVTNYDIEDDNESDNEVDEETRRIINETINKKTQWEEITHVTKQKSNNKKQPVSNKAKSVFSLGEFVQKVEIDEKAKQPKKFMSKRVEEKRKQTGPIIEVKPKRSFNPRLPPYNFVYNKTVTQQLIDFSNTTDFPSLN